MRPAVVAVVVAGCRGGVEQTNMVIILVGCYRCFVLVLLITSYE